MKMTSDSRTAFGKVVTNVSRRFGAVAPDQLLEPGS